MKPDYYQLSAAFLLLIAGFFAVRKLLKILVKKMNEEFKHEEFEEYDATNYENFNEDYRL